MAKEHSRSQRGRLLAALVALEPRWESEETHREADRLLLEYIGDAAITAAFANLLPSYSQPVYCE